MKSPRKEAVLLLLPLVALLGFAVLLPALQAKPKRTLTLSSIKVMNVAKLQSSGPDVEVDAQFNYSQSLQERYFRPNWSMTLTDAYILDGKGKKHYMMGSAPMIGSTPNAQQSIAPNSWSRDFARYRLWLRYFPQSAGKLTFHFTATAHDKFKLPVSVVVRS